MPQTALCSKYCSYPTAASTAAGHNFRRNTAGVESHRDQRAKEIILQTGYPKEALVMDREVAEQSSKPSPKYSLSVNVTPGFPNI